ncbi:FHA domain-containing protein FhaB/FipA [Actinocorallia populi]|uniref:FHA domain-containing protein FhaB/FipA n=1 Tax=Actinocorallia populi TaxID=2079200 RepID=UPI000D0890F8|nr:FHA domain-containing protein [Actinocorallia populi]
MITLTLIKIAFLVVLWLFVIAAVGVIRADLFGSRAAERAADRPPRQPRQTAQERARQQRQPEAPPQQRQQPQQQQPPQQQSHEPSALVVTEGPLTGTRIDLASSGPITIGRAPDSTLVVSDDYASSRHARIFRQDAGWILEDLNSTNGTYLGRSKVVPARPVQLPVGVPVRIGKTVIELRK